MIFFVNYEHFSAAGMAHREVLKLVALWQRSVRHKMMVDIMAMFFKYPLLRAALIAPVLGLGVASGHSPSVLKSSPSSQAGGLVVCYRCHQVGHIRLNCPLGRDNDDLGGSGGSGGPSRYKAPRPHPQAPYHKDASRPRT
jgi:hypothetical protein